MDNNVNYFEKLKENYVSYRTFNLTAGEEKQLMPLFEHILTALDGHRTKLATTTARYQGPSYSKPWLKEELGRVAAESREEAKKTPKLVLGRLKTRVETCKTAVATALKHEVVATDTAKNTQKMSDIEIRGDLKEMPEAERRKVLLDTTGEGSDEILGAIQRAPVTQKLITDNDVLERAQKSYLEAAAPTQIADLAQMEGVVVNAKSVMSQLDFELAQIDQQQGVASKLDMKVY